MTKALIQNNKVVQVVSDSDVFEVHNSMQWVDCSDNTKYGDIYENGQVINNIISEETEEWDMLRLYRDRLLVESDWTQIPDVPVDTNAWAVYRQELRDLPQNTTDPKNVVFPTKP